MNKHNCDNINCNHNNKGLCCLFNPDNCKYRQLQKENADLKCECRRCVYTDSPCVLSDYGKDKNGICDHFKDVFDENTELKAQLTALSMNRQYYC